jgi:hypothetical protein
MDFGFFLLWYQFECRFTQLSDDHNLLVLSKGFTRFSNSKVTGFMMLNGGLKKQKEEEEEKTFP